MKYKRSELLSQADIARLGQCMGILAQLKNTLPEGSSSRADLLAVVSSLGPISTEHSSRKAEYDIQFEVNYDTDTDEIMGFVHKLAGLSCLDVDIERQDGRSRFIIRVRESQ